MEASLYGLEQGSGTLEVLLYLYVHGLSTTGQIARGVRPSPEATQRTLRLLREMKLVSLEAATAFPFAKRYHLTGTGRMLVQSPLVEWPQILLVHDAPVVRIAVP